MSGGQGSNGYVSDVVGTIDAVSDQQSQLGPNAWLVEEMYERYRSNPSAVDEGWRAYFEGTSERAANGVSAEPQTVPAAPVAPAETPSPSPTPTAADDPIGDPIRGAGARIVANMQDSLEVPTATSYRQVPARLLEVNRKVINGYLGRTGKGKVSFTHLIAYALVRALDEVPAMKSTFAESDAGVPLRVQHDDIGLGLAVDVQKQDGSRTLLVPCVKGANHLSFTDFHAAYDDLVDRTLNGGIAVEDFSGITISLTNVGGIGTLQSVPRLMPGQSAIVGVGAIDYPAEFAGADLSTLADIGVSKVITISNTYDHRIIQGAESGIFLRRIHQLLLGEDGFYEDIFDSLGVPYSAVEWRTDVNPHHSEATMLEKQMQVRKVVQMYRVRGHLIADLDPLSLQERRMHSELDPATYGLTIWDLEREFLSDDLAGSNRMKLGDMLGVLRDAYSRTIGIEYMHIQDAEEKEWIQSKVEPRKEPFDEDDVRHILHRLSQAEVFEGFLGRRYVGHKRFGIEGAEAAIPIIDAVLEAATDAGLAHTVLGMAHRGRLNVLANIMGQSHEQLFRQFEGVIDENTIQGTGDVKYHLGAQTTFKARSGETMPIMLAPNPSHLETVGPVVIGMVRALQDITGPRGSFPVLPLLIHGDAAFAGQGVVAETLNTSRIPGFRVGGTVHLVINNQVGYTTSPEQSRSGTYATEVAKMVQAPIFHVNGDDPEACVRAARWAFDYRQKFHKDVVIDMICYRRHGHNEGDDPSYTQPVMYRRIVEHPSVRKRYTEALVRRGDITEEQAQAELDNFEAWMQSILDETRAHTTGAVAQSVPPVQFKAHLDMIETGVDKDTLDRVHHCLYAFPEGFTVHPKLERQFETRRAMYDAGEVDWGLAEALAFGTLLLDGNPVRLSGQDSRRGTFAHRHSVVVDNVTEQEFMPLASLQNGDANLWIFDSMLSEYAAMGFEYGYSLISRDALVAWEAQFGDFVNGAQIVIDQYLAAAHDKWGQENGLVLLLPHGMEGQGPEHSSARIERFLTLCADGNMMVANATTAAQFFHLLRRQAAKGNVKPLVVFTPKSLLRARSARSSVEELTSGGWQSVIDDPGVKNPLDVRRVALCSGKVGYEAMEQRDGLGAPLAVVRIEQLYPWPGDKIGQVLQRYPNAESIVWLQEEPANMGPWSFVQLRSTEEMTLVHRLSLVSRPESGSPACGSMGVHQQEFALLMNDLTEGL